SKADGPFAPCRVVGSVAKGRKGKVAALVDDPTPEPASFPPALIAGVGPEHQEQSQRGSRHLVRGEPHFHLRRVMADEVETAEESRKGAKDQEAPQQGPPHDTPEGAGVAPETPRLAGGSRRRGRPGIRTGINRLCHHVEPVK